MTYYDHFTEEEIQRLKDALGVKERNDKLGLFPHAVRTATAQMVIAVMSAAGFVCFFLYSISENQKQMQYIMSNQSEKIALLSNNLEKIQDQIRTNTEKIQEIWYRGGFNVQANEEHGVKKDNAKIP